jgi:methanethiol S-methyltransferase
MTGRAAEATAAVCIAGILRSGVAVSESGCPPAPAQIAQHEATLYAPVMPQFDTAHPLAWLWGSSLGFALTHSLLASNGCKCLAYAAGLSLRHYRLTFTVFAVLLTVAWLTFVRMLPDTPLYRLHGAWLVPALALQALGAWVVWQSMCAFDMRIFMGLKPFPPGGEPFVERGIYRHLRHPMYTGVLLILFAMPAQSVNSLHLYAAVALYFVLGSRLEERRLVADHPEYADYRRRVPAFWPRLGGHHE